MGQGGVWDRVDSVLHGSHYKNNTHKNISYSTMERNTLVFITPAPLRSSERMRVKIAD